MNIENNSRKLRKLLLGASSIVFLCSMSSSGSFAQMDGGQCLESFPCPGNEGRDVQCLNHKGEVVANTVCMKYEDIIGARPEPLRECEATCTRSVSCGNDDEDDDDDDDDGDPLIFNFDGEGVKLTCAEGTTVRFDMDNDGIPDETGWIEPGSGFLVLDENNNNRIDQQSEMFGNENETAFQELANHDLNEDGVIDHRDDVWQDLMIWEDINMDGRSQGSELMSVDHYDIGAVSLNYAQTDQADAENKITGVGEYEREDGFMGQVVEAFFRFFRGE